MKTIFYRDKFRFYLLVSVVFTSLWVFNAYVEERETFYPRLFNNLWRSGYITVLNYFLFETILPQISWKRFFKSVALLLLMLVLFSLGLYAWRYLGVNAGIYTSFRTDPTIGAGVAYHFPFSVSSVLFFGIAKHIYDYRKLKLTTQKLRIEKQEAELNYLKSQTNPHFLFNTLNNIYSLARDKSDLAPESILRLSKILRFMLYETGGEYITIEQEMKIINDYIALEKLRYDETLRISFTQEIEDLKQPIPPLLLIPLVENAFKHGVSETRNQPFVDIHLLVNQHMLMLLVKNSTEEVAQPKTVKENIGLSNLRRQLELLYTDHYLSVQQSNGVFIATLNINLNSHV